MPCSYCAEDGASPTLAKCPFIVNTDGAVGCRPFVCGRLSLLGLVATVGDAILTKYPNVSKEELREFKQADGRRCQLVYGNIIHDFVNIDSLLNTKMKTRPQVFNLVISVGLMAGRLGL